MPALLPRPRVARRLFALVALVAVTGCAFLGGRGDGGQTETGWKLVMQKVPPAYLVAVDRSECTVAAERFQKIQEGDNVFCVWRVPATAGGPRPAEPGLQPDRTPRPDVPPRLEPDRTPRPDVPPHASDRATAGGGPRLPPDRAAGRP